MAVNILASLLILSALVVAWNLSAENDWSGVALCLLVVFNAVLSLLKNALISEENTRG